MRVSEEAQRVSRRANRRRVPLTAAGIGIFGFVDRVCLYARVEAARLESREHV